MARLPTYVPTTVVAGMCSTRLALRIFVPCPQPAPADANVAAAPPRPGAAGATVPPSIAPSCSDPTTVGVHPSWLPEMDRPAAVPDPVKSDSWPDTDQPG